MGAADESHGPDERAKALGPIASLARKSEKALEKLAPGTWQHAALRDNLGALRVAERLLGGGERPEPGELREALRACASMIGKAEKAQAMFLPGTSHHALQRNRLGALRVAEALMAEDLKGRGVRDGDFNPPP